MKHNPIQFAVVREDPRLELDIIRRSSSERILLVASGGCTALSIACHMPEVELTLLDSNPAQIELVSQKFQRWQGSGGHGRNAAEWCIGVDNPQGLNGCGNFESLFRSLRRFIEEFVVPRGAIAAAFTGKVEMNAFAAELTAHPYWPIAFGAHFSDDILETMFGSAAIQHAPEGSYPAHFMGAFERGLRQANAWRNPFLHHVLLGHYIDHPDCLPTYLVGAAKAAAQPEWVTGELDKVDELGRFDFISLSNVTDWLDPGETKALVGRLSEGARPGATVLLRCLNTAPRVLSALGSAWSIDRRASQRFYESSRALFYNDYILATKR